LCGYIGRGDVKKKHPPEITLLLLMEKYVMTIWQHYKKRAQKSK